MRQIAVEFTAPGQTALCEIGPPPEVGRGQVLLETLYSGITNGTERHALVVDHGFGHGFPSRHGYQHVCRVAGVGEGASSVAVGDVVFHGWYVGHRGWHIVPDDLSTALMAVLPPDLHEASCALFGVAGVALHAVRRTRVHAGQRVWVVGLGPIGISGAQCARAVGAHVTASDLLDNRIEAARQTGMHRVIDQRSDSAWEEIAAGGPYDVIFDGSGYERLFHAIFEHRLLAHGGVIAAIAVRGETRFPWSMLHGTEASIEVSCHFTVDDLACLIHFAQTGLLRLDPIITHRVPITDAPSIYTTMRDNPRELYGVVFDWR